MRSNAAANLFDDGVADTLASVGASALRFCGFHTNTKV
jgi:hypothetical protein